MSILTINQIKSIAGSARDVDSLVDSTTLAGSAGADSVGFLQAGTGAVATTLQAKARETVSVKDFGAVGDGVTDDTAAIQAAFNTGKNVLINGNSSYKANNLTQSTTGQRIYTDGSVTIIKNANGPLLTSSGSYVEVDGIGFDGTGFTGHNLVFSGNHPRFFNVGSTHAADRALLATGSHVQIIGTSNIFYTDDASATGYDIEIGLSGTTTLYHQLYGVYTSHPTGGILLTDTGSHVIVGGQFGKLTIASGTSPSGVNGGITTGARILGKVLVGVSNAVFTSNQFSNINVEFTGVTSGCSLDDSNIFANGGSITNSQGSNYVVFKSYVGGRLILSYGGTTSRSISLTYTDPTTAFDFDGAITVPYTQGYKIYGADLTTRFNLVSLSGANNNIFLGGTTAGYTNVAGGAGGLYLLTNGTSRFQVTDTQFRPHADNVYSLGTSSQRFSVVYAGTGTINTSDARQKQQVLPLTDAEKSVAIKAKSLLKKFKFNDAVATKGDGARIHFGIVAQELKAAFESEGLVAEDYAVLCYDEWDAEPEILDEDGNVMSPAKPAGNRYGVRYEELLAFIIAAL